MREREQKTCERESKRPDKSKRHKRHVSSGGGLGSRPKKMYGKRLGDGVEYHLMSPTPRC